MFVEVAVGALFVFEGSFVGDAPGFGGDDGVVDDRMAFARGGVGVAQDAGLGEE